MHQGRRHRRTAPPCAAHTIACALFRRALLQLSHSVSDACKTENSAYILPPVHLCMLAQRGGRVRMPKARRPLGGGAAIARARERVGAAGQQRLRVRQPPLAGRHHERRGACAPRARAGSGTALAGRRAHPDPSDTHDARRSAGMQSMDMLRALACCIGHACRTCWPPDVRRSACKRSCEAFSCPLPQHACCPPAALQEHADMSCERLRCPGAGTGRLPAGGSA